MERPCFVTIVFDILLSTISVSTFLKTLIHCSLCLHSVLPTASTSADKSIFEDSYKINHQLEVDEYGEYCNKDEVLPSNLKYC